MFLLIELSETFPETFPYSGNVSGGLKRSGYFPGSAEIAHQPEGQVKELLPIIMESFS
jgi:hypothetical protein